MCKFMVTLKNGETFEVGADAVSFGPSFVIFRKEIRTGRWPWNYHYVVVEALADWAEVREI